MLIVCLDDFFFELPDDPGDGELASEKDDEELAFKVCGAEGEAAALGCFGPDAEEDEG